MRYCFLCRELIDGPAIVSEGNHYHPDHFCCDRCKQPVGIKFHAYKVWRLCQGCLPRPVCSSNQCSEPDRRLGHGSGPFYRLPVDSRLLAFHGCHTVRCSVCGRGIFCSGAPAEGLAYHLSEGKPTCSRCYYHVDHFNRWQRTPGNVRGRSAAKPTASDARYRPPLPDEFLAAGRPNASSARQATTTPSTVRNAKPPPPPPPQKQLQPTPSPLSRQLTKQRMKKAPAASPRVKMSKKGGKVDSKKKTKDRSDSRKGSKKPPGKSRSPSSSRKKPPQSADRAKRPKSRAPSPAEAKSGAPGKKPKSPAGGKKRSDSAKKAGKKSKGARK